MEKPGILAIWKQKARELELQIYSLYFAYRDPRVPWYAKVSIVLIVAYAFSPIDLIPDFIPIFGYLDDLVIVPLGVFLVLRMVPAQVMADCQEKAKEHRFEGKPKYKFMGIIIIGIWIIVLLIGGLLLIRGIRR